MKQIVYVLLRGGISPMTYVGTYATSVGALVARSELRKEYPDLRFNIIEVEVQP